MRSKIIDTHARSIDKESKSTSILTKQTTDTGFNAKNTYAPIPIIDINFINKIYSHYLKIVFKITNRNNNNNKNNNNTKNYGISNNNNITIQLK